ncbi:MAG TPA: heme peroxidase family protein [Blastocatellia bacterium]|nr:heme peroxidase family protein [Blastocatellia bacterium]
MFKIQHGMSLPLTPEDVVETNDNGGSNTRWPFWYMFDDLQADPLNLLPTSLETVEKLIALGSTMGDHFKSIPGVPVPTAYTFFGQFIDHDITLEKASDRIRDLSAADLTPIPAADIKKHIVNSRSPNLELDSVYGHNELVKPEDIPRDPKNNDRLKLGEVSLPEGLLEGKDPFNDLPRLPPSNDQYDRMALIGDSRNDQNLIVAQLHVAFLRAHNTLVDEYGCNFDEARKMLIQHYQWIVLNDFLKRVADPAIVKRVKNEGAEFFTPSQEPIFMPLEFAVAAYRFGHSKVRASYNKYNKKQEVAELGQLFIFALFAGHMPGQLKSVPGDWVIDWTRFLKADDPRFFSRPIDTVLAQPLLDLRAHGATRIAGVSGVSNLAVRNLLRGYMLSLPTGQAVAYAMRSQGITPLTGDEIASVAPTAEQRALLETSGFLDRTPLWFYILAEAAYCGRGFHLGPVGSTIVAEVLIEVMRRSEYSILSDPFWSPTLGPHPNEFDLADLLKLAKVL